MAIEIRLARRLIFDIFVHVNNGKTIVKHPMFDDFGDGLLLFNHISCSCFSR